MFTSINLATHHCLQLFLKIHYYIMIKCFNIETGWLSKKTILPVQNVMAFIRSSIAIIVAESQQ